MPERAPPTCSDLYRLIDTDRSYSTWAWALLCEITSASESPSALGRIARDIEDFMNGQTHADGQADPEVPFWLTLARSPGNRSTPGILRDQAQKFLDAVREIIETGGQAWKQSGPPSGLVVLVSSAVAERSHTLGMKPPAWTLPMLREISDASGSAYLAAHIAADIKEAAAMMDRNDRHRLAALASDPLAPGFLRAATAQCLAEKPGARAKHHAILDAAANALGEKMA